MRLFVFVTLKAVIDNIATTSASCIYDTEASDLRQAGHVFNFPAFFITSKRHLHTDAHLQHNLGSVGEVLLVPQCKQWKGSSKDDPPIKSKVKKISKVVQGLYKLPGAVEKCRAC